MILVGPRRQHGSPVDAGPAIFQDGPVSTIEARRLRLPILLSMLSILGTTQLACAGTGKNSASQADPCADFDIQVEKVWSASIRGQVMQHGGEIEVEKRESVVNKMDRISEDWVMMRTSVCKDHFVRGVIDQPTYAARVRCFDDRLERQRTLSETLQAGGDGTSLDAIAGSLDELLAQPASCEE